MLEHVFTFTAEKFKIKNKIKNRAMEKREKGRKSNNILISKETSKLPTLGCTQYMVN